MEGHLHEEDVMASEDRCRHNITRTFCAFYSGRKIDPKLLNLG
jgi:hypothetical protein